MPTDPLAARLALAKARQPQHPCIDCGAELFSTEYRCHGCLEEYDRDDDARAESWVQTEVDALRANGGGW